MSAHCCLLFCYFYILDLLYDCHPQASSQSQYHSFLSWEVFSSVHSTIVHQTVTQHTFTITSNHKNIIYDILAFGPLKDMWFLMWNCITCILHFELVAHSAIWNYCTNAEEGNLIPLFLLNASFWDSYMLQVQRHHLNASLFLFHPWKLFKWNKSICKGWQFCLLSYVGQYLEQLH